MCSVRFFWKMGWDDLDGFRIFKQIFAQTFWKKKPKKRELNRNNRTHQSTHINFALTAPVLCFPRPCVGMRLRHPAVHPHSFDRRTLTALRPTHGEREEVQPLLLLPVAAALVGAAGGADAVCGRPSHLRSGGREGMGRGVSVGHVPRPLVEVVAGRWDRLSFDVEVVVGASRPLEKEEQRERMLVGGERGGWWCHLLVQLTGPLSGWLVCTLLQWWNIFYSTHLRYLYLFSVFLFHNLSFTTIKRLNVY